MKGSMGCTPAHLSTLDSVNTAFVFPATSDAPIMPRSNLTDAPCSRNDVDA